MGRDDAVFIGALSAFAGALSWEDVPDAIPAANLADRGCFDAIVARFQIACDCDDRQAAISFWSQSYFSRLIVAAVASTLSHGHALPLDLDATRVSFCSKTGGALMFSLTPSAHRTPSVPLFEPLIDRHLAPLIAILQRHGGLSARLLWENAGWLLVWSLGEMARVHPGFRPTVDQVLGDVSRLHGLRHPLADMIQSASRGLPIRRRVCCLRHRIPGFERCAGLCPLVASPAHCVSSEHGPRIGYPADERFRPPLTWCACSATLVERQGRAWKLFRRAISSCAYLKTILIFGSSELE